MTYLHNTTNGGHQMGAPRTKMPRFETWGRPSYRRPQINIPIGVRLRVRDVYGREECYATMWESVREDTGPGQRGITLYTGHTAHDERGIRAEVEVHCGIYFP